MFIDERLLECVTFGTAIGPRWRTRRISLRSGIDLRNAMQSRPRQRFNLQYKNLTPDQHWEVYCAFNACFGGVHSFRLKDWHDFEVEDEVLSVLGTGAAQQVQLTKTYEWGPSAVSRPIRKPIISTVILTADNVPIAKTISSVGVASFTAANGAVLRWSGQFDVPVMFEEDELPFTGEDRGEEGLFLTGDVALIEDFSV